jgi:hypothetical protein
MARFLIDECVAGQAADFLRNEGHDALRIDLLRRKRTADDAVLWLAMNESRSVITHNVQDFVMLHRAWHRWGVARPHPGILLLEQQVVFRGDEVGQRVCEFLALGLPLPNELYQFGAIRSWVRFGTEQSIADTLDLDPEVPLGT